MQAKAFFRVAVLLPLLFLLVIELWEPRIWQHSHEAASNSFGIMQVLDYVVSYLRLGGGQYMLSAATVLCAMERLRCRSQVQLLFALCPVIFFLICSAVSLLESCLLPMLGVNAEDIVFGGVVLAVATLLLGSLYAFIVNVAFIVLRWHKLIHEPLTARH